ncbi:hypothetical protein [Massilia endophytica]|uniref:hypothetical protein n=1 Tax=Massilia endophytica TaxID=2899220 RepID=UPI001E2D1D7B|nr:hypothetical protein [Massilia endophytica]UGQ47579.1 hypothetical protein LSQ66_03595 [Massilia endophytica]
MNEREEGAMKMYSELEPDESRLFSTSNINHAAWCLVVALAAFALWLMVALVNAENQRNALMTKQCQDRVFKEEVDKICMLTVRSREHWWQHLAYALTNLSPQK